MSLTVSPKAISELRARTSAGMMDCKNALEEAGGDMDRAAELLRAKGIAKAETRAGRGASQGIVMVDVNATGAAGTMIELNCETDFVARTDGFRDLAKALVAHFAEHAPDGIHIGGENSAILNQPLQGKTVGEVVKQVSGTVGEAMALRRVARFGGAGRLVGFYLHHNGQVGVLVELAGVSGDAALALAREVALHIASADPLAVSAKDIPAEMIDRERRIAEEQVVAEGKPEHIRGKIVEGKLRKFTAERSLLDQAFVKDDKKTVGDLVNAMAGASVVRFARFKVGEG